MNDFEQVFGRVVQATGIASQTGLAEVLGVSPSAVSDAKKRGKFSAEWLLKLLEKQGINPVWLKSGAGPERLGAAGLPVVEAVVHGLACEYSDADERTAIHTQGRAVLPSRLLDKDVLVFLVRGAAMSPTLRDGALIGVNQRKRAVLSGQVYAVFAPNEGLILRRIFLDGSQTKYLLRADGEDFPEVELSPELLRRRMLGRVMWVLQDI